MVHRVDRVLLHGMVMIVVSGVCGTRLAAGTVVAAARVHAFVQSISADRDATSAVTAGMEVNVMSAVMPPLHAKDAGAATRQALVCALDTLQATTAPCATRTGTAPTATCSATLV